MKRPGTQTGSKTTTTWSKAGLPSVFKFSNQYQWHYSKTVRFPFSEDYDFIEKIGLPSVFKPVPMALLALIRPIQKYSHPLALCVTS